jgi:hypothetical protein
MKQRALQTHIDSCMRGACPVLDRRTIAHPALCITMLCRLGASDKDAVQHGGVVSSAKGSRMLGRAREHDKLLAGNITVQTDDDVIAYDRLSTQ